MSIFDNIENFGTIDAESDNRLIEYFYRTQVIDDLLENKKSIVIGRKGTGKTAIYKYIKNIKQSFCADLLFKHYPWSTHDLYINNSVSERESYVNSWMFYIYIEIIKKIIENKNIVTDKNTLKSINRIKKWLKRNWGLNEFNHKENFKITNTNKTIYSFAPQFFGNGLGSISKEFSKTKNDRGILLSEYNKKLSKIIEDIMPHFSEEIFIIFDELDLSYSSNDNNYKSRLIGLLLSVYSLKNELNIKIKIYLFLRNDIFNVLQFQDKNKLKDNLVEFLDWDSASVTSRLSLKNLIANRIRLNIDSKLDNFERNWNEIFDSSNIGKNQLKWNYIIERTFLRPRDIIKFMNLSLDEAKQRLLSDPDGIDKIINTDMQSAKSKYSTYLFEELTDEISSKYLNYEIYFEILRDIHINIFSKEDFEKSYNIISKRKKFTETLEEIMEHLYEFSIIGFYKSGGGGYGGSEFCFQYNSDYQSFNPNAQKFKIHAGFKDYLEFKDVK
jgi:hypothetical protein